MVTITPDVLTDQQCADVIALGDTAGFIPDYLMHDTSKQSKLSDQATLNANIKSQTVNKSATSRKLDYAIIDPVFPTWEGKPVYSCRVLRYQPGDFVKEHLDAQWMCMSNYWVPGTDLSSDTLVTIPLNDGYVGGEFIAAGVVVPQVKGTAIAVPQDPLDRPGSTSHGVLPVTQGTRYVLLFWNFS